MLSGRNGSGILWHLIHVHAEAPGKVLLLHTSAAVAKIMRERWEDVKSQERKYR
jgi:hypothetical protein